MRLPKPNLQFASVLGRHFAVISIVLVFALFATQFVILATLGTKGVEVSRVREQKDSLRVENEKLRAEIDEARTLSNIETGLPNVFNGAGVKVKPREINRQDVPDLESLGLVINAK